MISLSRHFDIFSFLQDYGDGGAFPEIHVAQYPLDMGRTKTNKSNAVAKTVDAEGKVRYDALARIGHGKDKVGPCFDFIVKYTFDTRFFYKVVKQTRQLHAPEFGLQKHCKYYSTSR